MDSRLWLLAPLPLEFGTSGEYMFGHNYTIITTKPKHPDTVGKARNMEPYEESLEPGEKPVNTAILQSVLRTPLIRPNSF